MKKKTVLLAIVLFAIVLLIAGCSKIESHNIGSNTTDTTPSEPSNTKPNTTDTTPSEPSNTKPNATDVAPREPFNTEPNTLLDVYKSYYELMESLIDDYGIGYNKGKIDSVGDSGLWWTAVYSGVVYAELIDFNNDGLPELLVVFNNGETWWSDIWAIYGYTGNVELYCEKYYGFEGGEGSDAEIALSSNGMCYLVCADYDYVYDDEREYYYYTVRDGNWDTAMTRSVSITDESRLKGDFQWQWKVNDYLVSENEYETAPETELGIIDTRSIPFYTRFAEDLVTKNERASDFVYMLLAELENRISQANAMENAQIS